MLTPIVIEREGERKGGGGGEKGAYIVIDFYANS